MSHTVARYGFLQQLRMCPLSVDWFRHEPGRQHSLIGRNHRSYESCSVRVSIELKVIYVATFATWKRATCATEQPAHQLTLSTMPTPVKSTPAAVPMQNKMFLSCFEWRVGRGLVRLVSVVGAANRHITIAASARFAILAGSLMPTDTSCRQPIHVWSKGQCKSPELHQYTCRALITHCSPSFPPSQTSIASHRCL